MPFIYVLVGDNGSLFSTMEYQKLNKYSIQMNTKCKEVCRSYPFYCKSDSSITSAVQCHSVLINLRSSRRGSYNKPNHVSKQNIRKIEVE